MGKKNFIIPGPVWVVLCLFWLLPRPGIVAQSADTIPPDNRVCRIGTIQISGNKITRDHIILRELLIQPGETLRCGDLDSLIDKSTGNLMNTLLFHFVTIEREASKIDPGIQDIRIRVTERWYVWPIPILKISDRNFNVWWETKDFSRLSYGFYIDWRNFRGRKEDLLMRFQFGYDQLYDFVYTKPYINRKKTIGIGLGAGYWRKRETYYITQDNRQEFYKSPGEFARQDIFAFGQVTVRPNIHNSHLAELRYDHHLFSDSLLAQNAYYSADSSNEVQYMSLAYLFKMDQRDFKSYPLEGYYADFGIVKQGLWTFRENTLDNLYILVTFRKYWELNPRIYFASGFNGKLTFGETQPYFILRGIGFDRDIVRSYEYYVVDARDFGIIKSNLKFALIPQRSEKFESIRTERFNKIYYALYLNVFFDAGYGSYHQDFGRATNDLQNALLMGYGAGFDFVTYYDIVIRLEFAMNFLNEPGIFLHFRAPI